MWSAQCLTLTFPSVLALHIWSKRDNKPHFILFQLKDLWDIAMWKKISSTHSLPSSCLPRKILSPPKQLLKIQFSFLLTALLKLYLKDLVVNVTYFHASIWSSKDLCLFQVNLKVVMNLAWMRHLCFKSERLSGSTEEKHPGRLAMGPSGAHVQEASGSEVR